MLLLLVAAFLFVLALNSTAFGQQEQIAYNMYREPCGVKGKCSHCGGTWHRSFSDQHGPSNCGHVYLVMEWDGTNNLVHATKEGGMWVVVYQDGLKHIIPDYLWKAMLPTHVR
jgi:hypothetical protein